MHLATRPLKIIYVIFSVMAKEKCHCPNSLRYGFSLWPPMLFLCTLLAQLLNFQSSASSLFSALFSVPLVTHESQFLEIHEADVESLNLSLMKQSMQC